MINIGQKYPQSPPQTITPSVGVGGRRGFDGRRRRAVTLTGGRPRRIAVARTVRRPASGGWRRVPYVRIREAPAAVTARLAQVGGGRGETARENGRHGRGGWGRTENERESRVPPPVGSISHLPGAQHAVPAVTVDLFYINISARKLAAFGTPAERARQISDRSGVSAVFEQSHVRRRAHRRRTPPPLP